MSTRITGQVFRVKEYVKSLAANAEFTIEDLARDAKCKYHTAYKAVSQLVKGKKLIKTHRCTNKQRIYQTITPKTYKPRAIDTKKAANDAAMVIKLRALLAEDFKKWGEDGNVVLNNKTNRWARVGCLHCGPDARHEAKGLCKSCYKILYKAAIAEKEAADAIAASAKGDLDQPAPIAPAEPTPTPTITATAPIALNEAMIKLFTDNIISAVLTALPVGINGGRLLNDIKVMLKEMKFAGTNTSNGPVAMAQETIDSLACAIAAKVTQPTSLPSSSEGFLLLDKLKKDMADAARQKANGGKPDNVVVTGIPDKIDISVGVNVYFYDGKK